MRLWEAAFLTVPETICECMAHSAQDLDLAAIAIFTESGNTARLLSKYRPDAPIFALSPLRSGATGRCCLWGTLAIQCERFVGTDTLVMMAEEMLEQRGF
jgi:pyruvate kinase